MKVVRDLQEKEVKGVHVERRENPVKEEIPVQQGIAVMMEHRDRPVTQVQQVHKVCTHHTILCIYTSYLLLYLQ